MDSIKNTKFGSSAKSFKDKISDKIKSLKENSPLSNKLEDTPNSNSIKSKFDIDLNMGKKNSKNLDTFYKVFIIIFGVITVTVALLFFIVINPILGMRDSITKVQKTANQVSSSLVTDRDLVAYEDNLKKLENDILQIRKERDSRLGHLKNFPYVREFYTDVDYFVNTGLKLVEAGKEVRVIVEPFADAMGIKVSNDQEVKKVGFAEAVATWITVMPKVAANLDPVILKLDEAGKELNKVNAQKYNINILGLYKNDLRPGILFAQRTLSDVRTYGPDAKEALLIFPGILGVGTGEQRYMIIMQNDAEIRATGGFWTNFATFKVRNALLTSDFTSKDMYSIDIALDAIDKYVTFPTAPEAYKTYLKVERLFARDTNISPDFPTAIGQFNVYYNMAQRVNPSEFKPVNGYIGINTEVVKEFIEITGPVNVNGVIFNKDNVVLELEKIASLSLAQQANRKKVLGDLMEAMLKNVFESDSFLWPTLIEKGVDLMNRKQVIVYLTDPNAQRLVEKYNYGGRIVEQGEKDYSFFVSTNLGGDKTNMFVQREITQSAKMENNKILRTVKVKYTYPQPSSEYADFIKRYQDWFRLYVPENAEFVSLNGNQAEKVYEGTERGKKYFGGFLTLTPNETKEIEYKYYIPASFVKNGSYELYIQKQSGQSVETYNFDIFGTKETKLIDTDITHSVTNQ